MRKIKQLITITISMVLAFTGIVFSSVFTPIDLFAEGEGCSAELPFEVSTITGQNIYTLSACYASFNEAKTAMDTLSTTIPDVVIRHPMSFSPSKIIAMSRGIAVTYDYRTDNTSTVYLYSSYNPSTLSLGGTTTYAVNHRDMQYLGTMGYSQTNGIGIVKIRISGFIGYINLKNTDLIPMIYLDNGWSFTLGGTPAGSLYVEEPFTTVPKMNKYTVISTTYGDVNGQTHAVKDLLHEYYSMWNSRSYGAFTYGPAPDWLAPGTYYSWDGITFYTDRDCRNPVYDDQVVGRYYQYYQYLPLRSDTKYTGDELDAYVEIALGYTNTITSLEDPNRDTGSMLFDQGANFISAQTTYGMNALLVFSLAYHESAAGTSTLAITKYNLFGWGAVDSNPINNATEFVSIAQSINEMMGIHLRGYISPENWRFFGSVFGTKNSGMNVKYASDHFWGEKIAGRAYKIDRWLGSKDYQAVDYAILNSNTTVNVEKTEGVEATDLYTLSSSLKEESLILLPFTKINAKYWSTTPTTMPADASGNMIAYADTSSQLVEYNRDLSKGYLVSSNLSYMVPRLVDGKAIGQVETLAWNGNLLSLSGYGFFKGYNAFTGATASHSLKISDASDQYYPLADGPIREQVTTDFGSGLVSYDGAGYSSTNIDLSTLDVGEYRFAIDLKEDRYGISTTLPFNYAGDLPADHVIDGKFYEFERDGDGIITLIVNYAILINPYPTTPTNQDVTVTATVSNWTLNETSHTFTENGSFTFIATDGNGGSASRTVTITHIDKVAPVITIAPYTTENIDTSLTVNATTNEGTLNASSHTFQNNGSFDFVATDAAGNITTKTVTITNIAPRFVVDYSISSGAGILSGKMNDVSIPTGTYLTNGSTVVFTAAPNTGYFLTQWTINGVAVANNVTNTLSIANITASTTVTARFTMFGDVNNDGKMSATDVVILRRYLAGLSQLSEIDKIGGDYNRDGKVSTTDVVLMRRKLAGLE